MIQYRPVKMAGTICETTDPGVLLIARVDTERPGNEVEDGRFIDSWPPGWHTAGEITGWWVEAQRAGGPCWLHLPYEVEVATFAVGWQSLDQTARMIAPAVVTEEWPPGRQVFRINRQPSFWIYLAALTPDST